MNETRQMLYLKAVMSHRRRHLREEIKSQLIERERRLRLLLYRRKTLQQQLDAIDFIVSTNKAPAAPIPGLTP